MSPAGPWQADVLIPAHRIVLALEGDRIVQLSAGDPVATFAAYRRLPDAVHGMIAWPNTMLLRGPATFVIDPISWIDRFGWRRLSDKETQSLFLFWRNIGQRMGLQSLPDWPHDSSADALPGEAPPRLIRRAAELIRPDFEERTWWAFWRTFQVFTLTH